MGPITVGTLFKIYTICISDAEIMISNPPKVNILRHADVSYEFHLMQDLEAQIPETFRFGLYGVAERMELNGQ
jgi:hypothetical protein